MYKVNKRITGYLFKLCNYMGKQIVHLCLNLD